MAVEQTKPWYRSSTVLINLAGLAVLVIDLVVQSDMIPDSDVVTILVAVANILNRLRAPSRIRPLSLK